MKHHQTASLVDEVRRYALLAGLQVPEESLGLLVKHLLAVIEANERVNLTRITDPLAGVRLHVVDSLSALPEVEGANAGALLDLGTGGGFPGLPLALVSHRPAVLLDSVGKKARILSEIVQELDLDEAISVSADRAEAHAVNQSGAYAVITARAVASLPSLVELASPLLQDGGSLVALKGLPTTDEVLAGDAAAKLVGMTRESVREFSLPECAGARTILVYRRTGEPSTHLPRREGFAQHHPLG